MIVWALLSCGIVGSGQAQDSTNVKKIKIWPEIGPSLSSHAGKSEFGDGGTDRKPIVGFIVGVGINIPVVENISIDAGLHLAQKGSRSIDGDFEEKLRMLYIDLPILAKYDVNNAFAFYGGVQPSFLISAKRKFDGPSISDSQKANNEFKTFDLAASVGVGYQISKNIGLVLRYNHGLINISGVSAYGGPGSYGGNKTRNSSVSITVGLINGTFTSVQYDRHGNVVPPEKGVRGVTH